MRIEVTELDMNMQEVFSGSCYTRVSVFDGENTTTEILDHRDLYDSWWHCVYLSMEACARGNALRNTVEL